jgi:hypothetical protein
MAQRQTNAKTALDALLDYANIPAPAKPLLEYTFAVQAAAGELALFNDYGFQAYKGLASYGLLCGRFTALQTLCEAETNSITR